MNIVMLDTHTLGENALTPLEQLGHFTGYALTSPSEVIPRSKNAHVLITNKVKITKEHMQALPNLQLICVAATGTNNIDLPAARECGVTVCNVAGYSTASVIQHTFTLMSLLLNNMHRYINDCHEGAWQRSDMFCRLDYPIHELAGKQLTIIGYGELGQGVEKVAQAFGMQVVIAERQGAEPRQGRMRFEDALAQADIVSIHSPLTEDTVNLINADTLALMKPSAVLINTARGPIINEADLAQALTNGTIAGAALDVLSEEPARSDNPLLEYTGSNLLLTPHTAWASHQARDRLIAQIALNITAFTHGESRNLVS
ncbi:D-2-hydroxyacid dehydrogenase [Pseudoalteromonas sp. SSDWG2]|uniref:D-2-hydroxyacid dehydrogenase n=1 Tax=Pseudoalteromonas sp. SSDWG2 TaxID=3139391 RepID=UPI003BA84BEE